MNQKIKIIICESLGISEDEFSEDLDFEKCNDWTSISHMSLLASLEEEFNFIFQGDEILELTSVKKIVNRIENI